MATTKTLVVRFLAFWSFITFKSCFLQNVKDEHTAKSSMPGDIILGGLFPLHFPGEKGPCSVFNSLRAIQEVEAFLFAVDQINADKELLRNVTLGVKTFDTCGDATSALNSAVKEFVLGRNWASKERKCMEHERSVVGVIGPGYSYEAVHITPFLNIFEIPLISYSATSPELSNKDKYEYFSRTASSDIFQVPAIINLLLNFNWTYVSVLYTDETYGMEGYDGLVTLAKKHGINFANKLKEVPQKYDEERYNEIVKDVLSIRKSNVIILFGVESAIEPLLYKIQENAGNRSLMFVGSDAMASAINEELNKVYRITQQAFFINLPTSRVEGFTNYFLNLSVKGNKRNPWFKDFFATYMNCTFDNIDEGYATTHKPKCNPNQSLASTNFSIYVKDFTQSVPLVVDGVYAFAHAFNSFLNACENNRSQCVSLKDVPGDELLKVLRSQSFQSSSGSIVNFTKNGDVMGVYDIFYHGKVGDKTYEYFKIGQWKVNTLHFEDSEWHHQFTPLQSTCETFCSLNQYRRKKGKKPRQCWPCVDCKSGSYAINETYCQECPKGEKPDLERRMCVHIIPTYLTLDGKVISLYVVVLPMVLASLGLVAVIVVFVIFIKKWDTPLVKASGRELSSLLLFGILLSFLFPFVAIAKPSPGKCFWQFVLSSLPYTICLVAIAVKNNRTYRIFNRNRVITSQPPLIRPKSQILVSLGLIAFQMVFLSALMILDYPRDEFIYSSPTTINYVCSMSLQRSFLSHLYNVLLLIACTYYGYKTRNIPRNFNEAKHIAFSMYGSCLSMIAFGVIFLFNSNASNDYGVVVEMLHNNLVGFIIIVCFFAPKIYIIVLKPEENANGSVKTEMDSRAVEHRK